MKEEEHFSSCRTKQAKRQRYSDEGTSIPPDRRTVDGSEVTLWLHGGFVALNVINVSRSSPLKILLKVISSQKSLISLKAVKNLNVRIAATRPRTSAPILLICLDDWVQFSACRIAGISSSHNFILSNVLTAPNFSARTLMSSALA
jgi:hypothetical protein